MNAPVLDQGDRTARLEALVSRALAIVESGEQVQTRMNGWAADARGQFARGALPRAICQEPSCGAQIIWAVTREGSTIPLDPRPACYTMLETGVTGGRVLIARAQLVMVTHFATCKNPQRFSRHPRRTS